MSANPAPRRAAVFGVVLVVVLAGFLVAVPAASAQVVLPCDTSGPGSYATVSKPPKHDIRPQEVVHLTSELDGVKIQIGIIRPDVPRDTRVPVIVDAGPYYHPMQHMDLRSCAQVARLSENFVPQGYAVAAIAVRGTGDSGGCMNLMGPKERADLDQAITWLGRRPWSNGAVGMIGRSYDGATPWQVASFGNPHLKTIVPISGVPDLFDLMYGGGVADWRGPTILNNLYYAQSGAFFAPGRSVESTAEVLACPEYADAQVATTHSTLTGELDPVGYWAQRRYRDQIEEHYRGSILLVQGLQDWNVNPGLQYPWVNELVESSREGPGPGIEIKHLLGQWGHANPDGARPDWADMLLAWFDRWLKGDRTVDLRPGAEVQDSQNEWRSAGTWPIPGRTTAWWLTSDGALAGSPDNAASTRMLGADPMHLQGGGVQLEPPKDLREQCEEATCAMFATRRHADGLRFSGLPDVRFTVTPEGPGGHLSAYLYAVGDDTEQRLGWGQVDLRFPEGAPRGTPHARTVTPGEQMTVDFDLQPLEAVVPPGAQLVMVISQGSAYNRLPTAPSYPVQLHVGAEHSNLSVTQVEPDRE